MALPSIVNGLRAVSLRFAEAKGGNVAAMFAVMLPVLLTGVGVAIDYSRAASARSKLQSAVDATALMISKEASTFANQGALKDKAYQYFSAIYNNTEAPIPSSNFTVVYTPNSGSGASVLITASGTMPTDFMRVAGPSYTTVPINVSSTTKWGNIRYRVALALDNTGSMSSANKMPELKSAATKLINDFYGMAGTNEDVYISIVPFAKDVNIGADKKNENWLRWDYFDENSGSCSGQFGWFYTTKTACQNAPGGRTWTPTNHNNWNGCVTDRDKDYDTMNNLPDSAVSATMVLPDQYSYCTVQMIGMTSVKASKQTLLDKITAMQPNGSTNQGIGVFWAWMTHNPLGPFPTPAKDSNYVYQDVIILLTDGLNTQNRFNGNGFSHSSDVDARQAILCTNARAQGIKIFAIQVATDFDPVSTVTKNCTSEPNNPNYFSHITQASQMTVKFQNIFKELARLRVAA